MNALFGLPPAFDSTTSKFGPFLSDPKCYFDTETGRWFHTILEMDIDPDTGRLDRRREHADRGERDARPARGRTTSTRSTRRTRAASCASATSRCSAPMPTACSSRRRSTTSRRPRARRVLRPADLRRRQARAHRRRHPEGRPPREGTQKTGTVQPATTPTGRYETAQLGTEYFMSAPSTASCPTAPWTRTRSRTDPAVGGLAHRDAADRPPEPEAARHDADQPGLRPAGAAGPEERARSRSAPSLGEPNPEIEANDARMNQVVYAGGRLWAGVNTIVAPGARDGIAWFQVDPQILSTRRHGVIRRQGYCRRQGPHRSSGSRRSASTTGARA